MVVYAKLIFCVYLPAKIAVAKLKFVSEQIKYFRKILENVKLESKL